MKELRDLLEISMQYILENHALGIKKGSIHGNTMPHNINPFSTIHIVSRNDYILQFII